MKFKKNFTLDLIFIFRERELLAGFLRQVTSLVHNAIQDINQSPQTLSNSLNQLLTQTSTIEHLDNKPDELRLAEVKMFTNSDLFDIN